MRTRGAVVMQAPGEYEIVDLELGEPQQGELLIRMVASGLCHSDLYAATGDSALKPGHYPWAAGHEGGGIVERIGPNTEGFEVGDHVVFSFIPVCGRCKWCASGMENLCDLGGQLMHGSRIGKPDDFRLHLLDGTPVGQSSGLSTHCEHTIVDTRSVIKVAKDLPLEKLCLLGCGVGTGWGAAVYAGGVRPGDTVIVMGAGGVGMNAVQGAAHAGALHVIVVDPVEFKREISPKFGGTEAYATIEEAREFARSVTNGQGADVAIVTVGSVTGADVGEAFSSIRKAGTVVVISNGTDKGPVPILLFELTQFQKRLQGAVFGASNPLSDIPRQIQMYREGALKLDELVTTEYKLDDIGQAYADMEAGRNIRGVVIY